MRLSQETDQAKPLFTSSYSSSFIIFVQQFHYHIAKNVVVAAIHTIIHSWCDHPVKGDVLFGNNMDRNDLGAKFSTPMSVLHWLSCKFCVYLYLGFNALLPECHNFHTIVLHVLHSLMQRSQSPSKFYVCSQMFCNVEFCEVDIIASITPQQPYHFHMANFEHQVATTERLEATTQANQQRMEGNHKKRLQI
jgi:hypothetical protein